MDLLKHYNYTIGYRPGHQNGAADALSRRQELAPEDPEEERPTTMIPLERMTQLAEITELTQEEYNECLVALIGEQIKGDTEIQQEIGDVVTRIKLPETIVMHEGLPYHGNQIYVPDTQQLRLAVMRLYHDSLIARHLGQQGTLELVRRQYWWENMTAYVRSYVQGCHTCARNKHSNKRLAGIMEPLPIPMGPWEWTQLDHITGLPKSGPYDAIYVVMDRFTKMSHFIPTRVTATAEDLVDLHLRHVWKIHGVPKIHNTDRGTTFTAEYT
jgi:Integrase zinc binding domain